jgi:hypothetical protein
LAQKAKADELDAWVGTRPVKNNCHVKSSIGNNDDSTNLHKTERSKNLEFSFEGTAVEADRVF